MAQPEKRGGGLSEFFRNVAHQATLASGSWQFFVVSVLGVVVWALAGPVMGYTDTWQLIVNTPTTVLTYLLGILILLEANRQSKESKLIHDELLRSVQAARTGLVNIDQMSDEEIDRLEEDLRARGAKAPSPNTEDPAGRV